MSRQQQPQDDSDNDYGWTPEAEEEYRLWMLDKEEADERDLPPHKRKGYAEQMAEMADERRDAERENLK